MRDQLSNEQPLDLRRLAVFAFIIVAAVVVVLLVMPGSLRKLMIAGVISLPAILILFGRPKIPFYILTFFIFSNVFMYVGYSLFEATYILAFLSWGLWALERRRLVAHDALFVSLAAAFLIFLFMSIAVARDFGSSIYRLKQVIRAVAFIFLTIQFVRDRKDFRTFVIVVASAIVTNNFLPMIVPPPAVYDAPSVISSQGVIRLEGLFFEPNYLSYLQNFVIPLFLFLMFLYRRPRIVRPLVLLAIMGSVAAIVLSFSRGGFLSFAVLVLVFLYMERRNKVAVGIGAVVIIVGLILVPPSFYIRIGSIFRALSESGGDLPVYTRLQTMKSALMLGIENPILGVGLENFKARSAALTTYGFSVHNSFLQVFVELGIFALGLFLAIIVYNIRLIRDMMRQSDGETAYLGKILMIQLVAVLFNSMTIPSAYENVFLYMLTLPSLAHHAYRPQPPSGRK